MITKLLSRPRDVLSVFECYGKEINLSMMDEYGSRFLDKPHFSYTGRNGISELCSLGWWIEYDKKAQVYRMISEPSPAIAQFLKNGGDLKDYKARDEQPVLAI